MATKGINVQASRFALLKVEDDDDSDEQSSIQKAKEAKIAQQSANAKKKNKKKRNKDQIDDQELRNLAFGGKTKGHGGSHSGTKKGSGDGAAPAQWEQWKKVDAQFTQDEYEKELEEAILVSKLDFEEKKKVLAAVKEGDYGKTKEGKTRKKKKDKTQSTMTLEEFNKSSQNGTSHSRSQSESEDPKLKIPTEADPTFFSKVENDAQKIVQKEKIQEEYRKQYVVENAKTHFYQHEIDKRDKEIAMLKESNKKHETELKAVKKRNQQLCHILAQGEMKDKTAVLLELDELKQVRDELTENVTELTTDLEKERSKVHALKAELDKMKGGKHGSK